LPLMIGIFVGLNYYLRRRMMRKMGMSMSTFGGNGNPLSFYCMSCGTKHSQTACPRCGSKMRKAGF
jgi:rubrerythrin